MVVEPEGVLFSGPFRVGQLSEVDVFLIIFDVGYRCR